jgi:hypothetical protein
MKRAGTLGAVTLAAVVAGAGLVYLGTGDNGRPKFEQHLPKVTSTVPNGGIAVGRMHIRGGPLLRNGQTPDEQLQGEVFIYRDDDSRLIKDAGVDVSGSFRVTLPPGPYKFVAHPANTGIDSFEARATIRSGMTTIVDLVEYVP